LVTADNAFIDARLNYETQLWNNGKYYIIMLRDRRRICGPSLTEASSCGAWLLNVYKCFHSCPINPLFFLTLHEISAVPLLFPKKGRSDICFDLPFFPVPYFTSSSAHLHFLEYCEHRSQVGNTGLWLVNVCLRCRPEDWLLCTGDSRSFTQSPKGNPGKAPHIHPWFASFNILSICHSPINRPFIITCRVSFSDCKI